MTDGVGSGIPGHDSGNSSGNNDSGNGEAPIEPEPERSRQAAAGQPEQQRNEQGGQPEQQTGEPPADEAAALPDASHDVSRDVSPEVPAADAPSRAAGYDAAAQSPTQALPAAGPASVSHVPVLPPGVYAAQPMQPQAAPEPPGRDSGGLHRRGIIVAGGLLGLAAVGGVAAAVAASGGSNRNNAGGSPAGGGEQPGGAGPSSSPSPAYPAPTLTTVPADGASKVDPAKPVTVTVANGSIISVQLSGGQETSGTLSDDKSSWTSNGVLKLSTTYRLQIQVADKSGKPVTKNISFSTLKPSATIGVVELWPGSGVNVGVGQPIRVQFTNYVPGSYRADVEKACVVTANPPVAGAWHWVDSDTMDWRPQEYWQTGTHVTVALNLSGVRAGQHQYFVKNHSLDFTIRDTDLRLIVELDKFKATAYINGQVARTFPVDSGTSDPRFVTWSGTLAVLGKGNPVEMKGDYGNGDKYDELVTWATQITYSGTYVHAAPWDGQIGRVNSSHGCIHARTVDATWFYNQAHVGDVVQVSGTNKTASMTNGFGDWTASWSSWLAGSAYGATIGGKPVTG